MITRLPAGKRTYHPHPETNAEIAAAAVQNETLDLKIGYPARRWICDCGASHGRGFFMSFGTHRCLSCGYVGSDGIMVDEEEFASLIHANGRNSFGVPERME